MTQNSGILEFDAKPFINAGLDIENLKGNYTYYGGSLIVGKELGNDKIKYS